MGFSNELPPVSVERVERAVLLEHACELEALVDPEAAAHPVGHVDLRGDRHLTAHGVTHRPHDLSREPRPVLEAATPFVGAPVQLR